MSSQSVIKIGVFYDGNFFQKVNNYYTMQHDRQARLSIEGLHQFIRHQVAKAEDADIAHCKIVDAHYFRGRLKAFDAKERNVLYGERFFEDILMREGVITHYLPLYIRDGKPMFEKGIDVWLALEAYELTLHKKFDVLVLIAGDGDFLPLIRKVHTLNTRAMLLSWDFKYEDKHGIQRSTRTSQDMIEECTYHVGVHELIESRTAKNDPIVNNLFVSQEVMNFYRNSETSNNLGNGTPATPQDLHITGEPIISTIFSMKESFGFIKHPPNNLYFHLTDVEDDSFEHLRAGSTVEFYLGYNNKNEECARQVKLIG